MLNLGASCLVAAKQGVVRGKDLALRILLGAWWGRVWSDRTLCRHRTAFMFTTYMSTPPGGVDSTLVMVWLVGCASSLHMSRMTLRRPSFNVFMSTTSVYIDGGRLTFHHGS
jgi:hypothetical protein